MYTILVAILFGVLMVMCFILGAFFSCRVMNAAQDDARQEAVRYEYYRMAGVRSDSDPKPYVPPVANR